MDGTIEELITVATLEVGCRALLGGWGN